MHRLLRTPLWMLAGLVAALGLLEILLRMLPVNQGIYGDDTATDWPVHRMVPASVYTYSMGWNL